MNLPFEANIKNKEPYIAADSGIMLWRKNFPYFIIFFAIPFWVVAFFIRTVFSGFLTGVSQYWVWLVLWYLKPLFDRSILHVISVRIFAPNTEIKQLTKGLIKNLLRGLPGDLLWRRFSPYRAVFMPMRVLENSHFTVRNNSERKKLLAKGGAGYCFLLTVWGLSLEIALLIGELLFIFMMSQIIGNGINLYEDNFLLRSEIYFFVLWCINYILVESIYICMGFGVYLNSRIDIEGWDIEILFKDFANKLKKKKTLAVLAFLFLIFIFTPSKTYAEDLEDYRYSSGKEGGAAKPLVQYEEAPVEILDEILSSPDFGSKKNTWRIQLKNPPKERENSNSADPIIDRSKFYSFIKKLEYFFASGLRVLLVIFAAAFAVILFIFIRRHFKNSIAYDTKPEMGITQNIRQKSPNELLDKAMFFYSQYGSDQSVEFLRLAWGYCTAALILALHLYKGFVFPPNATENDCAKIINAAKKDIAEEKIYETACSLIKIWINFAYAGNLPLDGKFDEAIAFCKKIIGHDSLQANSHAGGGYGQ